MVTIKDIAKQLGISISTVSKGLNGASDISEEMRQLVLDTALEMGYVTKNKRPTIRHKVAIIVENMEYENINQFGYEIMTGFRLAANEQQYEVSIIPVDLYFQAKQSYDNMMIQNGYSGAFILGFDLTDVYINQLQSTTIPTVLFDNYISNKHVGYIGTDNTAGIDALIQHLYDLGHRNIAFLNGAKHSFITGRRFDLMQKAMKSLDLEIPKNMVAYGEFDPSTAKKYVNDFINNGATAIVCGSDLIASGVINELHRIGKRVPEEISVTGFDDLPIAKYLAPPLTTVRQERFTLGKLAFMLLTNLIHNISITTLLLQSELIVRETTGPCNQK
ncbi:transcriptional regulator [Lachnospiraceae bacterium KM106-2]|nr:transcriptional regulator [Lachnospiraceae bacterium KM106-2]